MVARKFSFLAAATALVVMLIGSIGTSFAEKPTVLQPCVQCHKAEKSVIRGTLVSVTEKFRTINVQVGQKLVWVISYGDDLKLIGAEKLSAVPKDKEIGVTFTGDEKKPYAVSLSVKPPAKVAQEKLVSLEEMTKLIAEGPEKGNYVLIDSRPAARFNEGHLPYAVSLDNAKFDTPINAEEAKKEVPLTFKDTALPKQKDKLVIFYCGGVT
ncbi:MAG: rhodanese-like domain-containing protein [Nitrospirae bacterium]|nr:rhodanese-like domain-containing protein [Nitrospirota bacterium]